MFLPGILASFSLQAQTNHSFAPTDDAFVRSNRETNGYGNADELRVRRSSSADFNTYLKFNISGLNGAVENARIKLFVIDEGPEGGEIYSVSNNFADSGTPWNEGDLDFTNAPPLEGTPLDVSGAVSLDQVVEFDVTAAISGNGVYSFALRNDTGDATRYSSMEGVVAPELVVTTISSSGPGISFFNPTSGPVGTEVTISGSQLSAATAIAFDGLPASSFVIDSASRVRAIVPNGATSGPITVTTGLGIAVSSSPFAVGTASSSVTLTPAEDTFVRSARPTSNYGGQDELRVRQPHSDHVESYLKFSISGLSADIFSATLRLRVIQDGADGGDIYQTSNMLNNSSTPWTEDTMTLENAPPEQGAALFSIGPVIADQVVEIDLSSVIHSEGTYSFVIKNNVNDLVTYSSKEGSFPPELILQTGEATENENAPTIGGFAPSEGSGGTEVTISGANFVGVSAVSFNGSPTPAFTVDSPSQVRAFVPVTASTGKIQVITSNGTGTSASDFTVFAPPLLTSFSPTSGPEGTKVTLSGSNFANVTQILFNGTNASFSIVSDNSIVAIVPDAATTGRVSLTNSVGASVSSANFTVTTSPPPQSGPSTLVLNPVEDTMTRSNRTDSNYGASPDLRVRNTASAIYIPYMKFQVPAVSGEISRATLRLHVNDEGIDAGAVFGVSNNYSNSNQAWTEDGLRFHNAPEITGPELSSVGAVNVDDIAEWDVSSFVTGAGVYSFAVRNSASDMISFSSKDGTNPKPELVLEVAGASTAPFITGFSPGSGQVGTVVTINGGNFSGAVSVSFNGTHVFGFSVDSPTRLRTSVPAHASTGKISVATSEGTATSAGDFIIAQPPTISSFSPAEGSPGTPVTILGSNLATVNAIRFNGASASSFVAMSNNELQVAVPVGASTGPVTVTNSAGTATSSSAFTVFEPSGPVTLNFTPIDDAFVRSNRATRNHGDSHELRLRETSSADYVSYLKFNVGGVTDVVRQATLKLFVVDAGSDGGDVFVASNDLSGSSGSWNENILIFTNAPEISGSAISTIGPVGLGETVEVDVTSAIAGNGVVSLALRNNSSDVVIYASKEGGQAPTLEVKVGEGESLAPQISAFTPASGPSGTRVTIIGSNFTTSGGGGINANGTIAIMPLGNSLTQGVHGSTDNAGYRNDLAELLDAQGIEYDFVGTNSDGSGFDRDHEGHSGFRADELLAQLSSYLTANPPNLILLHIGTNDISELQTPATTIDEIEDILDSIRSFDSQILTIISSIVPRKDSKNGETTTLNNLIQGLVSKKIGAGYNLVYAAINEAFRANSNWEDAYMDDNAHPNDTGYAVMAGVWYDAILDALAASQGVQVAFNGVFANDIILDSETQLRATVPPGASTGPISVANFFGTAQSLGDFVVQSAARVLVLTNPAAGDTWAPGTTHAVTWRSSGNIGRVNLEYSADGGATWEIIADAIPNKGMAAWTVPDKPKDKVVVRVSETLNPQTRHETELGVATSYLSSAADLPSLGEMRNAALGMSAETDWPGQGDLDRDGQVDLYDILAMLDRNIDYGKGPKIDKLEQSQNETIEVSLADIKTVGDSLVIPMKVRTTAEIRGFQAQLQLSAQARFAGQNPILNEHNFLVYSFAEGNTLHILGYLKKEGGGVEVDGTLLTVKARVEDRTDETCLTIAEALFISSQMKAIPSTLAHDEFEIASVPEEFRLEQNYPNPFNITTRFHFSLPERAEVRLNIYNLRGELVKTLIHETREPGRYKATWDGRNDRGLIVASGIYIYRIQAGTWEDSKRLTLLK